MNKRIQELAEQAKDYADGIVDQGGEFHPAYTQKLAELIVRGCLSQVDKVDAMLDAMHEGEKGKIGVAMVGVAITRHFYFGHGSVVEFS